MKIIMATDGSEFSRAAIEKCCRTIPLEKAQVKVIAIAEAIMPMASEPFAVSAQYIQQTRDAMLKQAEEFAADAVRTISENSLIPETEVTTLVRIGDPARAIVEEAEMWEADLIVVGSHGYGFWGRVVMGSVSQAVINHAPCSVLVVRPSNKD